METPGNPDVTAPADLLELRAEVRRFIAERDWDKHHSPKNLAMVLTVEAAELLENFFWMSDDDSWKLPPAKREAVAHELADVLMGVIRIADLLDIDLPAAFAEKMALNRAKYPPEKVRGRAVKYTEL